MSAQRFIGANSREAMNQVRLVLGDEALILSSRMTEDGVEIMALAPEAQPPAAAASTLATLAEPDDIVQVSARQAAAAYANQLSRPSPPPVERPVAASATSATVMDFATLSERLLNEIQDMRQLIDRQTQRSGTDLGCRSQLLNRLLDAGFSAQLSEEILGTTPTPLLGPDATPARLQSWLAQKLDSQLNQLVDEAELFDNTRLIALVGPTGVGKTTTTAKLAARYVMRHGANQVALITTDHFRIGAHEQLRIYAQLLGVELHTPGPGAELDPLLAELADKRLVIIDTVGMSQRDQRLLKQITQLGSSRQALRLILVINATSHGDTLEEVVQIYRSAALAAGCRLDDCILSKCDEAARLGPALDIIIRHGLCLNYLSVGQQVPEDLQLPAASTFLQQALDLSHPSLFAAKPDVSTPRQLDALVRGLLSQSRIISSLRSSLSQQIAGFAQLLDTWPLMDLPQAVQHQRWAAFLSTQERWTPAEPNGLLLWGTPRPMPGATWNMPLLTVDNAAHLEARPWLTHRMPIGPQPRLDWCQPRWPAHRHVWSACPSPQVLEVLRHNGQTWLSPVKGRQRVVHQGELKPLGTLLSCCDEVTVHELRYRGRNVRLNLSHLPVTLKGAPHAPLRAWFGTLHDSHGGQCLGQRWWLASGDIQEALQGQMADLILQLKHDELARLTGRGWTLLTGIQPHLNAEIRVYLAAGLAATAVRLSNDSEDWAFQARTQLVGLLPEKRTDNASGLLESLLHLLTINDALSRMHNPPTRICT
ncbi:flagellar biosynthesis protein FlhF [Pseudomonas brassicacearum]|uniref:flagellar biosynthesis protein FlhF n=1 Tax=Pseudomonas brassicacearum TaxID=930166 RepID=UPI001296A060|nr:flagellar biosynthesis protein FlhF [Pseudomonas brassicacearum]QGA49599.1 flagellar biosynthesis protein FlhF [Pseudomonas brassicacearum]